MIYSLQVERHALSGLLKFPSLFPEIDGFVSENDFFNEVHSTIFLVIRSSLHKNEKIDRVIIASKIKDLGISFKDDINIFDYLETLYFSQINEDAVLKSFKELAKYRVRREIALTGNKLIEEVKAIGDKSIDDIVSTCDAIYNQKVSLYFNSDAPEKITDEMAELIEERGNSPEQDPGIISPYAEFNRMYGGFRSGNVYAIASRPGEGKTTWINDVCFKSSSSNKIKALILDTEMQTKEIKFRMAAALTGVPVWYLESGNWRRNPEMFKKVRDCQLLKQDQDYYHYHVSNKSIDEICSIIKRWYYNKVGRGNQCIIAYDYVKLTGEKISANWAEHQAIGEKINKLKEISVEVNAPLITAMQLNRSGENRNKLGANLSDDSSAISLSDRLQWYAAFTAIFRRKTLDEIESDGLDFGTHKLIPLKSRFQGKDAMGHQDYLRRRFSDGSEKYVMNYLNFDVNNFGVTEKGSLRHICERAKETYSPKGNDRNDHADI